MCISIQCAELGKDLIRREWKIEEFHGEIKQLTGLEFCQSRLRIIKKNHIACAILVSHKAIVKILQIVICYI